MKKNELINDITGFIKYFDKEATIKSVELTNDYAHALIKLDTKNISLIRELNNNIHYLGFNYSYFYYDNEGANPCYMLAVYDLQNINKIVNALNELLRDEGLMIISTRTEENNIIFKFKNNAYLLLATQEIKEIAINKAVVYNSLITTAKLLTFIYRKERN